MVSIEASLAQGRFHQTFMPRVMEHKVDADSTYRDLSPHLVAKEPGLTMAVTTTEGELSESDREKIFG